MPKFGRRARAAALAVVLVAAGGGLWRFLQPRQLTVSVLTDPAFRMTHANWSSLVESRFREVNRIYSNAGTGVRWKLLTADHTDPTATIATLDRRAAALPFDIESKADVLVAITGVHEGRRTGSAAPFARAIVVVDSADQPEAHNAIVLAHELAHLFGAQHEPAALRTILAETPETATFSPKSVQLIRRMRDYPFQSGVGGLLQGSWAKRAVDAIAAADPGSSGNSTARAHQVIAAALLNGRRRDQAIEHFRAAIEGDPNNAGTRLEIALAYSRNSQDDMAAAELREAVRLAPGNPITHRSLGMVLVKTHDTEAAAEELTTAARLDPSNAETQLTLGYALSQQVGRTDAAIAALQEALRLNPRLAVAQRDLDTLVTQKKRFQDEVARLRVQVQQAPADSDAHFRLGQAEERTGDFQAAEREFQKAIELHPGAGRPHADLALLAYLRGDYQAAQREVDKAKAAGVEPPSLVVIGLKHKAPQP